MIQQLRVGAYIVKQQLKGNDKYPLVLMLEPLFRCNLACPGCGKIDYPKPILDRRLSVEDSLKAVDECGAPVVSIPGAAPAPSDVGQHWSLVSGSKTIGEFLMSSREYSSWNCE